MGKKRLGSHRFFVCSLVALGCGLIVGPARTATAAAPDPAASSTLSTQINDTLGLRSSKLTKLEFKSPRMNHLVVAVPLDGESATLELELHSVRSPDYAVEIDFGGGVMGEVPAGPIRTYRGAVAGRPGSVVAAFEGEDGLHAKVLLPGGGRYWVEPVAGIAADADPQLHAVYRNEDVIPSGGTCDAHEGMRLSQEVLSSGSVAGGACGSGLCIAEIACDADVEYYLTYGSVPAVESRINAIINGLNVEYERDVDIRHVISRIIVRVAEPDPYVATDAQTLLTQFRSQWTNNHTDVPRDTAELFTGKNIDGSVVGIAWLGAICSSSGYSVVQADCCGSLACATDLSAHELGHNWNAGHCTCSGYTMNPSLTCSNQFHPTLSIPTIVSYRDTRSCLSAGGGCTINEDCNDGNDCTTDTCTSGSCFHTNNSGSCNDGLYCNGADTCSGGSCSIHAGNPCPPLDGDGNCSESCRESEDNCTAPDPNGSPCNDGLFCNGTDSCSSGSCSAHSGNPCPGPDGDADCTETCLESSDSCTASDPNGSVCNDGNAQTSGDVCSSGTCAGTLIPVNCDDGNPCTVDTVNGTTCAHTAASFGTPCNDNLFCNGTDSCNNGACSSHAGNPCPGPDGDANCRESCDESANTCTANDANGAACNDGSAATTSDACTNGTCAGTPISCDDNNPCTVDTLSGTTCLHTAAAFGTACNDGVYCNGTDACNAGACSVHAGNPCASGPVCANVCNEDADNCFVAANTSCTADGNLCTSDVCNGSGLCTHPSRPAGTSCNDNLYCNGSDMCGNSGVCLHTGNPCPGPDGDVDCSESCNEETNNCTASDANNTACGAGDSCQNGMCVAGSYCGDNVCDGDETCIRCPEDCGFPGGFTCSSNLDCCSGICRNGKCQRVNRGLIND